MRLPAAALLAAAALAATAAEGPSPRILDAGRRHLGVAGQPEWEAFASDAPEGPRLDLDFSARPNASEQTLLVRQRDVKLGWTISLNDRRVGELERIEFPLVGAFRLPAGALREGSNRLSITPQAGRDDIVVGEIALVELPRDSWLETATVDVEVREPGHGSGLPCRITIADDEGAWAPVRGLPADRLAVRAGVVYTPDGKVRLGLAPGIYTIYASRGFEYGAASARVALAAGESRRLVLEIARDVQTAGLASVDTHVHTRTYSGHGDATADERVLTLAGEGIDLPIVTEHDRQIDYSAAAAAMGVADRFALVVGNEVTTRRGHFNIFPAPAGGASPDPQLSDWRALFDSMRGVHGVEVVVLNHPRDLHSGFRPFDPATFNPVTGELSGALAPGFNAIEVVNSGALQSDPMLPFRDWFALLNAGHRVTAVAGSDSHDVSRSLVGQARTYVAADDAAGPSGVDRAQAIRSLKEGKAAVSFGLLADLRVGGAGPGALARAGETTLDVTVTVAGPSWAEADRIDLYADGVVVRESRIDPPARKRAGEKARVAWTIPRPMHDVYLVAIAGGPGIAHPFWPVGKPYQPTSRVWKPRLLGATNPVWVDADGDGRYTSLRGYATRLLAEHAGAPGRLITALRRYDQAVAAQAAGLLQASGQDVRQASIQRALASAPEHVRRGFAAFEATLP